MRTCKVQIRILCKPLSFKNYANSLGETSFSGTYIFSSEEIFQCSGAAKLYTKHSFHKRRGGEEMHESYKLGRLRCSADARITETVTIQGLLREGHRSTPVHRGMPKKGCSKMQIIDIRAFMSFVSSYTNGSMYGKMMGCIVWTSGEKCCQTVLFSTSCQSATKWISISSNCQSDTKLPNPYVMLG